MSEDRQETLSPEVKKKNSDLIEEIIQAHIKLKDSYRAFALWCQESNQQDEILRVAPILFDLASEIKNKWVAECFDLTVNDMIMLFGKSVQSEADALNEYLHTLPYAEYLLTPHWQNMRRGALERAQHRCQVCNASKGLHVHHRTYERRGYEHNEDLIVLCEGCHQLFHDHGKLEVQP